MSQAAKKGRAPGARILGIALLAGLSLALGACGGGGGGDAAGGSASGGGINYVPGDGPGTAQLTWAAPTEREDGRALAVSELGGFRIHFGPTSDPNHYVIDVQDGSQSQYVVTGLAPDTYSFSVSALDTGGLESGYSNSMSKTIAN